MENDLKGCEIKMCFVKIYQKGKDIMKYVKYHVNIDTELLWIVYFNRIELRKISKLYKVKKNIHRMVPSRI